MARPKIFVAAFALELLSFPHDHERPIVVTRIVSEQKLRRVRISCSPTLPECPHDSLSQGLFAYIGRVAIAASPLSLSVRFIVLIFYKSTPINTNQHPSTPTNTQAKTTPTPSRSMPQHHQHPKNEKIINTLTLLPSKPPGSGVYFIPQHQLETGHLQLSWSDVRKRSCPAALRMEAATTLNPRRQGAANLLAKSLL